MSRIRLEWSQLWAAMGETFNAVGCHTNPAILFLLWIPLRQLSMRFWKLRNWLILNFRKNF